MSHPSIPSNASVDFKEVKSRVGILQVLERYDLLPSLKRSADRLSGCCPLHQGTNPTQFRVSVSKNCWNCFGNCGRGGNVIDFVQMREAVPFRDAALLLQSWFMPDKAAASVNGAEEKQQSPSTPQPSGESSSAESDDELGENPPLSFELKSLKQDHPYLTERGLNAETVRSYGIGYCTRGCLRGHVAIPIRNREGVLTGYIGRWPGIPPADQGKYKLPKGFRRNVELFNLDRALKVDSSLPLLVVEGVFDCLHLVQLGYQRTVALLGSSLSTRQETLLRDAVKSQGHIRLLLDVDEAGYHGTQDAIRRLGAFCQVEVVDISSHGTQPDQLKREHLAALLPDRAAPAP